MGGPVVSSPVIKKLGANSGAQTFPLTVTDPDFGEFTCSVGTIPVGVSSQYMTVSPNCEVTYALTVLFCLLIECVTDSRPMGSLSEVCTMCSSTLPPLVAAPQ